MKDSRATVLQDIQHALGRKTPRQPSQFAMQPINLSRVHDVDLVKVFIEQAQQARNQVIETTENQLISTIAQWLEDHDLKVSINIAPALADWDWRTLTVQSGPADEGSIVSVTPALCGIAETGTVLCTSGPDHPTTLNFLSEVHMILLDKSQLVATYEQAWYCVEAQPVLPRTVNFISGPSRTGDIEQTLQFGAHGPKQCVILLYGATHR